LLNFFLSRKNPCPRLVFYSLKMFGWYEISYLCFPPPPTSSPGFGACFTCCRLFCPFYPAIPSSWDPSSFQVLWRLFETIGLDHSFSLQYGPSGCSCFPLFPSAFPLFLSLPPPGPAALFRQEFVGPSEPSMPSLCFVIDIFSPGWRPLGGFAARPRLSFFFSHPQWVSCFNPDF